jgi:sulfite exporter TauE/SafE
MIENIIEQIPGATPVFVLVAGFVIGLAHAFEPDHVAAVATQATKARQNSSLPVFRRIGIGAFRGSILGALWGAGHTSMLILVSLLIFVFSLKVPNEVFSNFELIVGMMLVFLGISIYMNKKLLRKGHVHPHIHEDGTMHAHEHSHNKEHRHGHKSYIIGCVHGLAGSGALVVLALSTLNDVQIILSFILVFGVGSILGMMMVSGAIGLPFAVSTSSERIHKFLRFIVGAVSIIIGFDILYSVTLESGNFFGLHL